MKLVKRGSNKKKPILPKLKKNKVAEEPTPLYTDLRQVMDYKRDLSIFYSGVEYDVYLNGCYEMGIRNFLMSYHYLQGRSLKQITSSFDEPIHLFIDSGAYTYINDPKYENTTVEEWEVQLQKYLKWAERHKEQIFAIANFDFESIVGCEVVDRWNREFFEPFMLRTGLPVCFVWHEDSAMSWERYCQRYPYVGFSSVNTEDGKSLDISDYMSFLKTAEKYNTLVHGMGMTRTSLLPQLPYYTVDSTSWKSGMRYGVTSVWNGKKVQQFKKEQWDDKIIPVISTYKDISLDLEKLREFYEPEVIRANVYAYIKAEEYIVERLKPLMYWKKARVNKNKLEDLSDDFFPTPEWIGGDKSPESVLEYAQKMNINPELKESYLMICDMTVFIKWDDPEYMQFREVYLDNGANLLKSLHDQFINQIVPDDETMIRDLQKFYIENLEGTSDTLLQMGTNFDRQVKERDKYLEESEEYDMVDLSPEEVRVKLAGFLPTPKDADSEKAPEIDGLDEEIYRQAEIVPTFDEKGRFIKGQKAVRKPKQVYSKVFPKMSCDTCHAAAKCPQFKQGYVCAFNKIFGKFDTRNMTDLIQAMQGIVGFNFERMQKAMIVETLNGGIDPVVSQLMETNIRYATMLKSMYENGSKEVIRQTNVIRSDGSSESTVVHENPQSGGILERLFFNSSGAGKEKNVTEESKTIEADKE